MSKKIVTTCLSISLVVIFIYLNDIDSFLKSTKFKNIIENSYVKIIDLSRELEPENVYRDIKCRKSAKFIIETTLCIHPLEKDIWVSSSIWNYGVFEGHIVCKFKFYFQKRNLS